MTSQEKMQLKCRIGIPANAHSFYLENQPGPIFHGSTAAVCRT